MNRTSKIIALVLSLVMILGTVSVLGFTVFAVEAPSLSVSETSKSGNKVTVSVNLNSGNFNAMGFQFNMSDGVTCDSISATGGVGNKANGKVSMASVDGYSKGSVITATFTVPEEGSYEISGSVLECAVTDSDNNNVPVSASVSGSAKGTNTKTTKSTTKSTEKPTTKSTSKSSTKPSTTKKGQPTTKPTTTKKGQPTTKPTTTKPTTTLPTTKLPDDLDITSEENLTDDELIPDDEDAFGGIVEDDYGTDDENTETETEPTEDEDKGVDVKLIGIIAGAAVVLVGGAVTAIVLTNRKKNNEDDYE